MGTMTINTTGAQDARIAPAFGDYLGLGRNANAGEIKTEIGNFIRLLVENYEKKKAVETATATALAGVTSLGQPS